MGNNLPSYTREEVAERNTKMSQWIIIDKKVYNVTDFKNHAIYTDKINIFEQVAGTDCSYDFHLIHKKNATINDLMDKYLIGYIK
jgi:cytochrome b involved in lipid metabolism